MKISSKEIESLIKSNGWYEVSQNGSHKNFKHLTKAGKITIPMGRKDLPKGTVNSILKQAGLK